MCKCQFCGKEFEKSQSLAAHKRHCKLNPNFNLENYKNVLLNSNKKAAETNRQINKLKNPKKIYKFICNNCGKEYELELTKLQYSKGNYSKFCSRSCANRRIHSDETKKKISNSIQKRINNGEIIGFINKPIIQRIEKSNKIIYHNKEKQTLYKCKVCGKLFEPWKETETSSINRKYCSNECHQYNKLHQYDNCGGYRKGSGRGKSGWYKGIYCDSSWELAFVIYHKDQNLNIERCKERRKYIYNNKEHIYIPDFITDKGIIEIKGYSTPQWKAKEEQNKDIKVLYKSDIQFYIDYVNKKYGNDFINLYDNSKPIKNDYSKNVNVWIHKYDLDNKIYYTMVINPKDLDKYLNDDWLIGRGTKYDDFIKEHIKTRNIFNR